MAPVKKRIILKDSCKKMNISYKNLKVSSIKDSLYIFKTISKRQKIFHNPSQL